MIHLITYSDDKYENAKKILYKEAKNTGWFDTITLYGPDDLDDQFKNKFKNILKMRRGAGYWIWKSYIIKKKLEEIAENDILIYLDAGCCINKNGENRFNQYIEMLNKSEEGIISFQMSHLEKVWTTKEIFKYFNIDLDSEIANSGQILGGIRIMKKCDKLIKLIELESKVYHDNPLLATDYYNFNQERYFRENRHEQSVFSIIRKIHGSIILYDETWFEGVNKFGRGESLKYPFWAVRRR
jgi:hypothetical protein